MAHHARVELNLVIAALIDAAPLRERVQALAAPHTSIWRTVDDVRALTALLQGPGPEPDMVITDRTDRALLERLHDRAVIVLAPHDELPVTAVALPPGELTATSLADALVNAINLTHTARLLQGLPEQDTSGSEDVYAGFDLHFQPQWSVDGQRLTAAEALLRWHGMEVAALRPDSYIAAAEAQGHVALLGDWILDRACALSSPWLPDWPESMVLAINVTPAQLAAPAFLEVALQAATSHALDPALIEFELNAQDMPQLADHARRMQQLSDLGFGFTLDRIGGTVFEPALLRSLPWRTLKIDRSVVHRVGHDPAARALIEQLVQLAARLGLACTAVGVETDEQRAFLTQAGVDAMQGYLLAEALTAPELGALLKAQRERRRDTLQ
jgi:EAL domain-containing protein (putative c-di-GMP-specific phosphodiesterase class I)